MHIWLVRQTLAEQLFSFSKAKSLEFDDAKEQRQKFDICTLEREIRAIESAASDFEVGVCHNDITGINIIHNRETGEFSFIDFEYCCLNYVAFDVGNLFCEYVGYTKDRSLYPSEEEQTAFIRAYLSARTDLEVTEESVERFKHQVRICAMVCRVQLMRCVVSFSFLTVAVYASSAFEFALVHLGHHSGQVFHHRL